MVILVAFSTLTMTWIWAYLNKFWMGKKFAYTLMTIYCVFFVAATVYSLLT